MLASECVLALSTILAPAVEHVAKTHLSQPVRIGRADLELEVRVMT